MLCVRSSLVNRGLALALELHRAFPDMPQPHARLVTAQAALKY